MPQGLFLVRHGRPVVDTSRPPNEWELDPDGHPAIRELARSGRLPDGAVWYSSPEPKARATASLLTDGPVEVEPALREHERGVTGWVGDPDAWAATVGHAFEEPDVAALPGWEPLTATRDRLVPAVRRIIAAHPEQEVVLVGHGTAWTLLVAELTGTAPDLAAWRALRMPDLWVVEP